MRDGVTTGRSSFELEAEEFWTCSVRRIRGLEEKQDPKAASKSDGHDSHVIPSDFSAQRRLVGGGVDDKIDYVALPANCRFDCMPLAGWVWQAEMREYEEVAPLVHVGTQRRRGGGRGGCHDAVCLEAAVKIAKKLHLVNSATSSGLECVAVRQ